MEIQSLNEELRSISFHLLFFSIFLYATVRYLNEKNSCCAMEIPTSMDECLYFTNRVTESMRVKAWARKKECPKCHKALMGKPVNEKTGKVKIRSTDYVCPECGFEESKPEHEATLKIEAQYKCPACGDEGETTTPYKRKTYQGVPSFVIECNKCGEKMALTKKLKEPKKKK